MKRKVVVVIPVFQNALSIERTCREVLDEIRARPTSVDCAFVLVNDGSTDDSWMVLRQMQARNPDQITLINLTRNFGQVAALLAGYRHADGDCVVSMAADLQDPPVTVGHMVDAWLAGHKLVVAGRQSRHDGWVSDTIANVSWRVLRRFALPTLPEGGFDFFLMDREIVDYFVTNPEQNIFIQGRLLFYGRSPHIIPYDRMKRASGRSQTSLSWRIKYLIDGFAGYSFAPLRLLSLLGVVLFLVSILLSLVIAWYVLTKGSNVEGWASLMIALLFLTGLQFLAFGVMGEYLWRAIEESRRRPHYVASEIIVAQREAREI